LQAVKVFRVLLVLLVYQVLLGFREDKDFKAAKAEQVDLDFKALRDHKGQRVLQVDQVLQAVKVFRVLLA
jgi:hypothetical protein